MSENLGQRFIEPQTSDLSLVFKDSSPTTPLIFVLSVGTDPAADLYKFAEEMRFSKKLSAISLGQGQVGHLFKSCYLEKSVRKVCMCYCGPCTIATYRHEKREHLATQIIQTDW